MKQLLNDKTTSDVIFELQSEEVVGHKAIIACRCPALAELFDETVNQRISLPDVNASTFKSLLEYIYTDRLGYFT